jgi:hypothetical protein
VPRTVGRATCGSGVLVCLHFQACCLAHQTVIEVTLEEARVVSWRGLKSQAISQKDPDFTSNHDNGRLRVWVRSGRPPQRDWLCCSSGWLGDADRRLPAQEPPPLNPETNPSKCRIVWKHKQSVRKHTSNWQFVTVCRCHCTCTTYDAGAGIGRVDGPVRELSIQATFAQKCS